MGYPTTMQLPADDRLISVFYYNNGINDPNVNGIQRATYYEDDLE